MIILDLIQVSKNYESTKILCQIDFNIKEGEKVAIIGKNGGGKSTLLKICNGILEFDEGRRVVTSNMKIEMLDQNPTFKESITVKEAIEEELKELKEKKDKFEKVSIELSNDYENRTLIQLHSELSTYLDTHHAWNLDDKIERILQEFKLKPFENQAVNLLSGGEQRRVALAGLLLKKPDLLLLDEPTNHLDVYMVKFLEELLLREKFTILFISHDRYFIDKLATRSIEIDECKIRSFDGGYTSYLHKKEELLKSLQKEHENLLKYLKQEEEWLSRGVRARIKRNKGRKKRVFQLRDEAKKNPSLIRKIKLELEREQKNFNQQESKNRKKMLFEIEKISKSLGNKRLIENFTMRILQQDKIAIVGRNGTGKSTLLKLLLSQMNPDSGEIKKGDFKIGYFDQNRTMLNDDKNLIETFCPNGGDRVDVRGKNMHVYGYLKNFLFPKEHLDKKIGILSGGEKNRVALALLFTKKYDCLILDEPTNDLDINTINILEEYLQNFDGALIFVSHDRFFVDKIAKKLLIFKGNGLIEESYQSYSEYLEIEEELVELENFSSQLKNPTKSTQKQKSKKPTKLSYKDQKAYEELPIKIESLEKKVQELQNCLENPKCYNEKGLEQVSKELIESEKELNNYIDQFLEIEEQIEKLNKSS